MADPGNENRELDTTTASMNIHALNNVVVSLRGLMKKVQLFTIQKLVRQSKQLRLKNKSSEDVGEKKRKKAERLISEVGTIKELKIDHAVKYALANTRTFEEVAAKGDLETRAKVRLATHPLMVERVEKWRKEHCDWQALAAFIMYKNTGRRFKKKKKKDNTKVFTDTAKLSTPKVAAKADDKAGVNTENESKRKSLVVAKIGDGLSAKELARKARTAQKELFLQKKAKQGEAFNEGTKDFEEEESGGESESKEDEIETSDNSERGTGESEEQENNQNYQKGLPVKEFLESDQSSEQGGSEYVKDSDSEDISSKLNDTKTHKKAPKVLTIKPSNQSQSSEDDSSKSDEENDTTEIGTAPIRNTDKKNSMKVGTKLSKSKLKQKNHSSEKEDSRIDHDTKTTKAKKSMEVKEPIKKVSKEAKLRPKSKPIGYKAGKEMAIKKIDLHALSEDVEDIPIDKKADSDISFLFASATELDEENPTTKQTSKKKDAFFSMDGEADDVNDDNDVTEENGRGRRYDSDGDNDMQRRIYHRKIESAFIGRLSDKQAKGDWGDGKGSFSGQRNRGRGSRGRSFSDHSRGRGSFSTDRGRGRGGFSSDQNQGGYRQGSLGSGDRGMEHDSTSKRKLSAADEGKLHPSWEAKRLKKERENKIAVFTGTKIKFDD